MRKTWLSTFLFLAFTVGSYSKTIEGSKNPELIPDDMAFEVIVWNLYVSPNATENDKTFSEAYSKQLGLTDEDRIDLQKFAEKLLSTINKIEKASSMKEAKTLDKQRRDLVNMKRFEKFFLWEETERVKQYMKLEVAE